MTKTAICRYGPSAACRMSDDLVRAIVEHREGLPILLGACTAIAIGSFCYGATFGAWLSMRQAFYAAVKMPLLIFAVTLSSALINVMLAQVLGAALSFRQVSLCILLSLAIASTLMGALSPVALFFVLQAPPPDGPGAMVACRVLLVMHTGMVGLCGVAGNIRLYRLLNALTGSTRVSIRVMTSWILVSGLLGCELSWVLSPFLGRPDAGVPFLNPNAFSSNFFEYLWMMARGSDMQCL